MIDDRTVRHMALLARLEMKRERLCELGRDLATILAHIDRLSEVDTDEVEPTFHPLDDMRSTMRPDEVRPGLDRDEVVAMAPDAQGGMLRVPGMMNPGDGERP